MRSSEKILSMMEAIKKEEGVQRYKTSKELVDKEYSKMGKDSIFGGGKNSCFTWSCEKFEMLDIHLPKSKIGWFVTIPRTYTTSPANYKTKPYQIEI